MWKEFKYWAALFYYGPNLFSACSPFKPSLLCDTMNYWSDGWPGFVARNIKTQNLLISSISPPFFSLTSPFNSPHSLRLLHRHVRISPLDLSSPLPISSAVRSPLPSPSHSPLWTPRPLKIHPCRCRSPPPPSLLYHLLLTLPSGPLISGAYSLLATPLVLRCCVLIFPLIHFSPSPPPHSFSFLPSTLRVHSCFRRSVAAIVTSKSGGPLLG
jgi:hypothetical protein